MANVITFKFTGVDLTIKQLQEFESETLKNIREDLRAELESWLKEAQENTPVDTGALQESGRLLKPRGKSSRVRLDFTIIFGGVTRKGKFVDYAVTVHEGHPQKSMFLEKVVQAREKNLENIVGKAMEDAMRRL